MGGPFRHLGFHWDFSTRKTVLTTTPDGTGPGLDRERRSVRDKFWTSVGAVCKRFWNG